MKVGDTVKLKQDPTINVIVSRILNDNQIMGFYAGKDHLLSDSDIIITPQRNPISDYTNIAKNDYGNSEDLNNILISQKMSGELTNVFFSMHYGNTQFFAHQFKPFIQFIRNSIHALIIADEVGLGKTVEAMYIWREMQVRENAKNLLIVCPKILAPKWERELQVRFSITADQIDHKELNKEIEKSLSLRNRVCICTISDLQNQFKENSELRKTLADHAGDRLFDLVIFDEAHKFKNQGTKSYNMARLIRSTTKAILLLTATPVSNSDQNLFSLLTLVSPNEFNYKKKIFTDFMNNNMYLIRLCNYLRRPCKFVDKEEGLFLLDKIKNSSNRLSDQVIEKAKVAIENTDNTEERIMVSDILERSSYLARYVTRSRKAQVLENRVQRVAHVCLFDLTEEEQAQYDAAKHFLDTLKDQTGNPLMGIVRKRMIASCLPVGIDRFNEGLSDEDRYFLQSEIEGVGIDLDDIEFNYRDKTISSFAQMKKNDSKYKHLKRELHKIQQEDCENNKIILFTSFRSVGDYLLQRLSEDGFIVYYLHGNQDKQKTQIIEDFENCESASILLSTEVGAEGIDLQFCHIMVNYDLPWNPMRIEQRIGRIDRIGQQSPKVLIYNMSCSSTIEDRVLEVLYNKIHIFENTIGDLDDILGSQIEKFVIDITSQSLTEEDIERKIMMNDVVAATQKQLQQALDSNASILGACGLRDLAFIKNAEKLRHYITSTDIYNYVTGFFREHYDKEQFKCLGIKDYEDCYQLILPHEAIFSLNSYCRNNNLRSTQLADINRSTCYVYFQQNNHKKRNKMAEVVDLSHPLIKWINTQYKKRPADSHPVEVMELNKAQISEDIKKLPLGMYYYYIERWDIIGNERLSELRYRVLGIAGKPFLLKDEQAETLINDASYYGFSSFSFRPLYNQQQADTIFNRYLLGGMNRTFDDFLSDQKAQEEQIKEDRRKAAKADRDIVVEMQQSLMETYRMFDKKSAMRLAEGKIKKAQLEYEQRLFEIDQTSLSSDRIPLASGIIHLTE